MRLSIYGLFTVGIARQHGGWSKGRPLAYIEGRDKCVPLSDPLIPNNLDDKGIAWFVREEYCHFARPGEHIVLLDAPSHRRYLHQRRRLARSSRSAIPSACSPPCGIGLAFHSPCFG